MTKQATIDFLFILLVAAICHYLFSPYGFNPTDEGFVLSATNRVLHGQIPHVDFSSVRPLGYAYLHIPELILSKKYFFLISRFVFWVEVVLIAFLWIRFIFKYSKTEIPDFLRYSLILICFVFNVHYFPCSVLHTIDGLFMCLIGFNIIISENKWNFTGFFFIGFAALCKQNYLVLLPLALLLFGRKNILLNLTTGVSSILLYITFICYHDGAEDLIIQLSGHNELIKVGVISYLTNPLLYIGFISIFIFRKLRINKTYLLIILPVTTIMLLATNHYHGKYIFLFWGILCGSVLQYFIEKKDITLLLTALLLGWCVSISVGYNSPALFSGCIISLLLLSFSDLTEVERLKKTILPIVVISIIAFYHVRKNNIYRDVTVKKLTYKLDNITEGALGIYTNENTYLVLQELDSLMKSTPNIVVVPDFTACNILHSHESKILTEWPNKTEIPNDKILQKVTFKINNDTSLVFAIPVFQTALLKDGFTPQVNGGNDYKLVRFIKDRYKNVSYSRYFEIRKK